MSINMKIFQIYFKPELAQHCDPLFDSLDNTANPRPELREWDVWDRYHEQRLEENLDLWGYFSWKFKEKTNLTGQQVFNHIISNPGHDVYLFNPCVINEALWPNSWYQGDMWHKGISGIANTFLDKVGYTDVDVLSILLDRNKTVFANYVVGNQKFWTKFMEFSRRLFTEAEKDPAFNLEVFGLGRSNYAYDSSLPMFTFLIERLIPTFIELEGLSSCPYVYDISTLPTKYQPVWSDIKALSDLKVAINRYESDELYAVWDHFRTQLLQLQPQILQLE